MRASEKRGSEGLGPGTHFTGSARGYCETLPYQNARKPDESCFGILFDD